MMARQRGFTLIEVMVAILLMAVVALIAWRGLDSVSRADEHLRLATERDDALLRALNQLQRDLDQRAGVELDPRAGPTTRRPRRAPGGGAGARRRPAAHPPGAGAPRPGQPGALQRVRWWVEGGVLRRATSAPAQRYPLPPLGRAVTVLEGVGDFQLRTWAEGSGWHALAGTPVRNPRGLELRFSRETPQGHERYRQVFGPLD
ncbi:prepilin-type N-terminal cleavage/methylation domain-containing protein [Metapseudomonas otitidis]